MRLRLNKWRNSLGFRIPKHLAEELSLHANSEIECNIQDGTLVIEPISAPEYT
jgi:antitoxin MazE